MSQQLLQSILTKVHDALAHGALSKGWGGPECFKAIPLRTHLVESSFWVGLCLLSYFLFDAPKHFSTLKKNISKEIAASKIHPVVRAFEVIVGTIHVLLFLQLVYYKSNISSLINLLQPCHVICLLQGLALLSTDSFGVLVGIFVLPALTGTTAAMLFPETGGLDQPFEMEAYWIQHYFIEAVPLYLLLRRGSIALRYSNFYTILGGLWILAILHFSLYEIVDYILMVNVEFMLCPTDQMVEIFAILPPFLKVFTHRSVMTFIVIIVGIIISYVYIGLAHVLKFLAPNVFGPKSKTQ